MVKDSSNSIPRFMNLHFIQVMQVLWWCVAGLGVLLFFILIPTNFHIFTRMPASTGSSLGMDMRYSTAFLEGLDILHIPPTVYASFKILARFFLLVGFHGMGYLIFRSRFDERIGMITSFCFVGLGSFLAIVSNYEPDTATLSGTLYNVVGWFLVLFAWGGFYLFIILYPDGRFKPRWSLISPLIWLLGILGILFPESGLGVFNESNQEVPLLAMIMLFMMIGIPFIAQVYRYFRVFTPLQRQQAKWFVLVLIWFVFIFFILEPLLSPLDSSQPIMVVAMDVLQILVNLSFLLFPFVVGMAILRYQLWEIDIILNRTLVYGLLTAMLVGIYALIVSGLGLLVQDDGNFLISLLGAGVIAVIFQPLRDIIQRTINRWIFGQRDEPLAVMIELGKSLEMIISPEAALQHLVDTTAQTLKLPYVAIEHHDKSVLMVFGKPVAQPMPFPLIYQAENIGTLLVSPRSPSENLATADKLMLENIARQTSNLVHAARLTQDLQQSRQQILTTREEERRRLRRDLHDGLGPALATLTLQAEAASEWLRINPEKSEALLQEIISGSQSTLSDIRRIVYDLRPPALDELGLISAIREQANQFTRNDLLINVDAPEILPPLPAAVEVATYRIVQEALTNVTRHSQAHLCNVSLRLNGKMDIEITDDGIGIPRTRRAGVGLNSMHERAAELGGSCVIASESGMGTQIMVSLPRE